jgi:hypothetical protein
MYIHFLVLFSSLLLLPSCGKESESKRPQLQSNINPQEQTVIKKLNCYEVYGDRKLVLIVSNPKIEGMALIGIKSPNAELEKILSHKFIQLEKNELVLKAMKGPVEVRISLNDLKAKMDFSADEVEVDFDCENAD